MLANKKEWKNICDSYAFSNAIRLIVLLITEKWIYFYFSAICFFRIWFWIGQHDQFHTKIVKELGPRTANMALSICLKMKMIEKVFWRWLFSKWTPADFMSVVLTSFSNRFLHYDVMNSVIITEIRLLCWN